MEVEVKLRLLTAAAHLRLTTLLTPFHLKTLHQRNLFFDTPRNDLSLLHRAVLRIRFLQNNTTSSSPPQRCVLSLKAKPTLSNGISRVEEDEEEIDSFLGQECVDSPSKLSDLVGSRVLKRVREEYGFEDFRSFVCLGGFENVRNVYEWRGVKLEVDETKFGFGDCYEVECETEEPERVKSMIVEFLSENEIEFEDSGMTKFAVFRSGKLPSTD